MIYDIFLLITGMALMKGLIEPIVATQTQRLAKSYVPILLNRLDPIMPAWIASKSPEELRDAIFQNLLEIEPKLSKKQQEQILARLRQEYDPLINSGKVSKL